MFCNVVGVRNIVRHHINYSTHSTLIYTHILYSIWCENEVRIFVASLPFRGSETTAAVGAHALRWRSIYYDNSMLQMRCVEGARAHVSLRATHEGAFV